MSGPSVSFYVSASSEQEVIAMLERVQGGVERFIGIAAETLEKEVRHEAGSVQSKLGERWEITGVGPNERSLEAPEWWAHFFSGGTRDHGPTSAPALSFDIDGEWIHALHVRGIPASHFDEKAIRTTEYELPTLFDRYVEELAL